MSDTPAAAAQPAPAPAADPVKKGARWVAVLIALNLLWYFLADRFTPTPSRRGCRPMWCRWPAKCPSG